MRESLGPSETGDRAVDSVRLLSAELLVGLVAAAMALLLFSWLGRDIAAGVTPAADEFLRSAVHDRASPTLTQVMIAASAYGGPRWLFPLGFVLALAFLVRGWPRGAFLIIVTMLGAGLLNTLLKQSFARTRPTPFFDYPLPLSHSFPSGHAFFAASFFGGLAVLISSRVRRTWVRIAVWTILIGLILLVGFSRVYLGVHYPSDVLAGDAAAVVWVTTVAVGDRLLSHRRRRRVT
jgi:membrane-associated phospholipid phosphatase